MFDVYKDYKLDGNEESVNVLKQINLNEKSEFKGIEKGELVMIRGPSGGGKTTLLNIMGTIDNASSGRVEILGQTINHQSTD